MKILLFILFISHFGFGQDSKVIGGFIMDAQEDEPAVFVQVVAFRMEGERQVFVGGAYTDFDGIFRINSLESEVYRLVISSVLYDTVVINGIDLADSVKINLDTIQLNQREMATDFDVPRVEIPFSGMGGVKTLPTEIESEDIERD